MAENKGVVSEDIINLKVIGQENSVIFCKIKKHTPLQKLMTAYCEKKGLNMATIARFHFDGERLRENDTPSSIQLEDGDIIEVFLVQTGG